MLFRSYPNLGVVSLGNGRSFVIADIPGVIEGAAEGAGLGIRFLKHLARTRLLLHLVDIAPLDEAQDPLEQVRQIEGEVAAYGGDLAEKERWLVLNKVDLLDADDFAQRREQMLKGLDWDGPVYCVSALTGMGTDSLCEDLMRHLEQLSRSQVSRDQEGAGPDQELEDDEWHPLD